MKESSTQDSDSNNSEEDLILENKDYDMDSNESNCEADMDESAPPHKSHENLAWADAMSKILKSNKPRRRKTIVLSRAKRANQPQVVDIKEEKLDFEIEGENKTEIKIEPSKCVVEDKEPIKRLKKKEWASKGHVKPNILEREREKALLKVATRGVVQLFNAVKESRKTFEKDLDDAGPMEHKKDRVMKSLDKKAFLDVLMGPSKSQPVSNLIPKEIKEDADNPTWSILRDDFMMSSKLKDWDKDVEVKEDCEG